MKHAIKKLSQIPEYIIGLNKLFKVAVVASEDVNTLEAIIKGAVDGFLYPILIGDELLITKILPPDFINRSNNYKIVDCRDKAKASELGVAMVKSGEADIVMKGLINTDLFLKSVLDKERGILKSEGVLSYVCALELPKYKKLLFITDPAVLPFPSFEQKIAMINYAVEMTNNLGIDNPKVALIGASEKVSKHFPNSEEYQRIVEMANKRELKKCIIDGPLDLFLACDPESVKIKGIDTPVNGDADILLFPSLESCNPFYKGLMLFGDAELAGLIQGTTHPVVVMSRSESFKSKYYCLALACLMAENKNC